MHDYVGSSAVLALPALCSPFKLSHQIIYIRVFHAPICAPRSRCRHSAETCVLFTYLPTPSSSRDASSYLGKLRKLTGELKIPPAQPAPH